MDVKRGFVWRGGGLPGKIKKRKGGGDGKRLVMDGGEKRTKKSRKASEEQGLKARRRSTCCRVEKKDGEGKRVSSGNSGSPANSEPRETSSPETLGCMHPKKRATFWGGGEKWTNSRGIIKGGPMTDFKW